MKNERPILIYHKHAEKSTHKMKIPKQLVECWGYEYYMEVYPDKIVLRPRKFEKEEKAIVTNLKASTQSIFPNKFNNFFLYEDYFKVSYLLLYSQQMT